MSDGASAGVVLLIFLGFILVLFGIKALFLHVATGWLGFQRMFSTAFGTTLLDFVFVIVLGIILAVAFPIAAPVAPFLSGTLAVMVVYRASFWLSFAANLLSMIIGYIAAVVFVFVLAIALGVPWEKLLDDAKQRLEKTPPTQKILLDPERRIYSL